jgi:hypothetical protein
VPDDYEQPVRPDPARRRQRVPEQAATTDPMKNFGCRRLHAGAFASGEDDDGRRPGVTHVRSLPVRTTPPNRPLTGPDRQPM